MLKNTMNGQDETRSISGGLAGQFLAVEQELAVSQEDFAHAAENQYIPDEVDISVYDGSADEL